MKPSLITSAGHVRTSRAVWRLMRIILAPVNIACAAIAGEHAEHRRVLDAGAVYLGPGK
jgi:hypothetical protein